MIQSLMKDKAIDLSYTPKAIDKNSRTGSLALVGRKSHSNSNGRLRIALPAQQP